MMDADKIQQMQQGYEQRIQRQKESIGRLQDMVHSLEGQLRVAQSGWDDEKRKAAQFAAEAANLRTLLDAANAASTQPTDPHTAPAEWDRRVPERDMGPTESTSDEVLAFDAWTQPAMPQGEERPATVI
jgi:hypothetical protein